MRFARHGGHHLQVANRRHRHSYRETPQGRWKKCRSFYERTKTIRLRNTHLVTRLHCRSSFITLIRQHTSTKLHSKLKNVAIAKALQREGHPVPQRSKLGQISTYLTPPCKNSGRDGWNVWVRTKLNHCLSRWKYYISDVLLHFEATTRVENWAKNFGESWVN